MKELKLRLTDEQFEALQKLTVEAELAYKQPMSVQAVMLAAMARGCGDVAYEIANVGRERKLRIVK